MQKNPSRRQPNNPNSNQNFDKGSKYTPSAKNDEINTGGNFKKNTNFDIRLGVH